MVAARVIPCLDIRNGRVVKGVRFAGLRDAGDPVECAKRYAQDGADELVILDVSATTEERAASISTVSAVREVLSIPLTVGGGMRSVADADLLLRAGADKIAVNSAAVERPDLISELKDRFGRQCTVLALDAASSGDSWEVVIRSGTRRTGTSALEWAARAEALGAGEILLTSWDRDGTGAGYDLQLIAAIRRLVWVPIIASGGAHSPSDLADALAAGADAVLAATVFHDGMWTIGAVKSELAARGYLMRGEP